MKASPQPSQVSIWRLA